jgi:hypothetical protein
MAAAMEEATGLFSGYSDDKKPLGSYAALTAAFSAGLATMLANAARDGRLPDDVDVKDIVLFGIATHKLSRILSRDKITSFLRAPFTRYEGPAHINEINEIPRGDGFQRSMGELIGCPLCIGTWIGGAFISGLIYAPKTTRVIAALLTSLTIADSLHLAYAPALGKAE